MLLVVAAHSGIAGVAYGGAVGVTVFFTLSGFLITHLCLDQLAARDRIDLQRFYLRRTARLGPALLVMLAGAVLIGWAYGWSPGLITGHAMAPLLYVADFVRAAGINLAPFDVTWSLAVEEQFYLVWPPLLLCLWGAGVRGRFLAWTVTVAALAACGWHLAAPATVGISWAYFFPDTNAFGLALGCAAACWLHAGRRIPAAVLGPAAGLVLAASLPGLYGPATDGPLVPGVQLVAALLTVPLIAGLLDGSRLFSGRPLRLLGAVSYGWYLWHFTLITIGVLPWVPDPWRDPLTAGIGLLLAGLSWRWIEQPVLRFVRGREEREVLNETPAIAASSA